MLQQSTEKRTKIEFFFWFILESVSLIQTLKNVVKTVALKVKMFSFKKCVMQKNKVHSACLSRGQGCAQ